MWCRAFAPGATSGRRRRVGTLRAGRGIGSGDWAARLGQDVAAGLWRDFEGIEHQSEHSIEAGAGDGFDNAVAAERGFGAPKGCGAHLLARQQFRYEIIDHSLVVAAEFRPPARANGLDSLIAEACLTGQIDMRG